MTASWKRKSLEDRAAVSAAREDMSWPGGRWLDGERIVSLQAFLLALAKTHQRASLERGRFQEAIRGLEHRLETFRAQRAADAAYIKHLQARIAELEAR
jgi:hypothetical protein